MDWSKGEAKRRRDQPHSESPNEKENDEDEIIVVKKKKTWRAVIESSSEEEDNASEESEKSDEEEDEEEQHESEAENKGEMSKEEKAAAKKRKAIANKKITAEKRRHQTYQELEKKLKKLSPKEKRYTKRKEPDPRVVDREIQKEVYERGSTENHEDWDAQANGNDESAQFHIDYLIGTNQRKLGDMNWQEHPDSKALIKWSYFPVPTWEAFDKIEEDPDIDEKGVLVMHELLLDFVEHDCREEMGAAVFEDNYPHRYLKAERGKGDGGYVVDPRSLYANRLASNEYHYNIINSKNGQPPVYVQDWSKLEEADETLKELEYIQQRIISPEVKYLIENTPQQNLKHLNCTEHCKSCTLVKRMGKVKFCCRLHESLNFDKDGVPRFIESGLPTKECFFRVECTDDCECKVTRCANRILQKGRQKPLLIFRHHKKQWSLRTLTSFKKDELITEYVGEVILEPTTGRAQQYDLNLEYGAMREDGEKRSLYVNAYKKGNESRFISHSCEPNAFFQTTVIDRRSLCLNQSAIHAARDLVIGEEITLDYFGGKNLGDKGMGDISEMFPKSGCACATPSCRYTRAHIEAYELTKKKK